MLGYDKAVAGRRKLIWDPVPPLPPLSAQLLYTRMFFWQHQVWQAVPYSPLSLTPAGPPGGCSNAAAAAATVPAAAPLLLSLQVGAQAMAVVESCARQLSPPPPHAQTPKTTFVLCTLPPPFQWMSVLLCAALQVGAQAMAVVESLARRLSSTGGAALLVDYGANKPYSNSLTGEQHSHLYS